MGYPCVALVYSLGMAECTTSVAMDRQSRG